MFDHPIPASDNVWQTVVSLLFFQTQRFKYRLSPQDDPITIDPVTCYIAECCITSVLF